MPDDPSPKPPDTNLLEDLGDVPLSLIGTIVKGVVMGIAIGSAVFGLFALIGRRH